MENIFDKKMREKTDFELKEIIASEGIYHKDAISSAINELKGRNLIIANNTPINDNSANNSINESKEFLDAVKNTTEVSKSISRASYYIFTALGIGLVFILFLAYIFDLSIFTNSKLLIPILTLGILFYLTNMILKGKYWARNLFAVLYILSLIIMIPQIITTIQTNIIISLLSIITNGLQIYAIIILFNKESRDWYNEQNLIKTKG